MPLLTLSFQHFKSTIPIFPLIFFQFFFFNLITSHKCSSPPSQALSLSSSSISSCPPFTSPLSFPFSSSPGCGHPSFQIQCSHPHSLIFINNFTFSLLHYQPNSTSLLLSLHPSNFNSISTSHNHCSSSSSISLLNPSITLSGSPFRFSHSSCSKLTVLKPCPPKILPNCSLCSWECALLKNPSHLLNGCESNQTLKDPNCKQNVFEFLDSFLKSGIQVEWDENHEDNYFSSCKICQAKNGTCGFNSSDSRKPFLCFQTQSQNSPLWIHGDKLNRIVLLCTVSIVSCLILVFVITKTIIIRCRGMKLLVAKEDPTALYLHQHCSANLLPPVFSYKELESSTNMFDSRRKIGDGGFGSVYLGQLYDGRIVAVKKLHRNPSASTKSFCNEILILSSISHPNLVKLHGYCSDPRGLLLVYDYVPNGTLADHLHGSKSLFKSGSLTWQLRIEVALQTAIALEYLHFKVEPAIVHRDITSSNIFLEKDMKIKVGDFGLSRLLILTETSSTSSSSSCGYVCTGPQGTPGYLDPEYYHSFRLTEKSDVYSFGVILFELISGMKAVDLSREKREISLVDLVVGKIQLGLLHQVVDPVLIVEGEAIGTIDAVAELAFRCVASDKDDRPDTAEIVTELKRIKNCTRCGCRNSNVVDPELFKS